MLMKVEKETCQRILYEGSHYRELEHQAAGKAKLILCTSSDLHMSKDMKKLMLDV